ncbi:hypothetical protein B0H19DRAFT_1067488 [Mycena capillaripes]|nr:hypothetical protein B0H19DRAFT_1067488 [Mycena capillaripes]
MCHTFQKPWRLLSSPAGVDLGARLAQKYLALILGEGQIMIGAPSAPKSIISSPKQLHSAKVDLFLRRAGGVEGEQLKKRSHGAFNAIDLKLSYTASTAGLQRVNFLVSRTVVPADDADGILDVRVQLFLERVADVAALFSRNIISNSSALLFHILREHYSQRTVIYINNVHLN